MSDLYFVQFIISLVENHTPTMKDLHRYFIKKHAADWKDIGLELELKLDILKAIRQNNTHKVEDCLEDVLDRWLKLTPSATWGTLELALTNVNRQKLDLDPVDDVYSGEILIAIEY